MSGQTGASRIFYGWYVVLAGFICMAFGAGIWTGFGVFFKPLLEEFGASRGGLSLVISVGMVFWAVGQLTAGILLNRFGPRRMITLGVGLMGLGCLMSSWVSSLGGLFGTFSVFVAIGAGLSTMNSVSVLISRWFIRARGTALGLTIAGFNAGQFLLIPFSQGLITAFEWRTAFLLWAGMLWVILTPLLWAIVRDSPEGMGLSPDGLPETEGKDSEPIITKIHWFPKGAVREALATRSFWLLFASYFACGFTDFIVYVHLPVFAVGIGATDQMAANSVGMVGGLSIIGVIGMGALADRIGFRVPLVVSYGVRCVGILLLALAGDTTMLFIAIGVYGLFHLATTPLTPGMTAALFGHNPLGTLYGYLLCSHSLGALLGPFVAGVVFDRWGRYDVAFFLDAAFLAAASLCCLALKHKENPSVPVAS